MDTVVALSRQAVGHCLRLARSLGTSWTPNAAAEEDVAGDEAMVADVPERAAKRARATMVTATTVAMSSSKYQIYSFLELCQTSVSTSSTHRLAMVVDPDRNRFVCGFDLNGDGAHVSMSMFDGAHIKMECPSDAGVIVVEDIAPLEDFLLPARRFFIAGDDAADAQQDWEHRGARLAITFDVLPERAQHGGGGGGLDTPVQFAWTKQTGVGSTGGRVVLQSQCRTGVTLDFAATASKWWYARQVELEREIMRAQKASDILFGAVEMSTADWLLFFGCDLQRGVVQTRLALSGEYSGGDDGRTGGGFALELITDWKSKTASSVMRPTNGRVRFEGAAHGDTLCLDIPSDFLRQATRLLSGLDSGLRHGCHASARSHFLFVRRDADQGELRITTGFEGLDARHQAPIVIASGLCPIDRDKSSLDLALVKSAARRT